ncbi:ComEA family DNA-binding protein [Xylophilus ampelinus]|uniref:Competence protein ComEA n=1 Tax=Xylophilus ampelinus TaxID=54067 RepID=A0A318SHG3_9BURK|nr:helix-hairpin-helix domain-containing protein [Xylophilus ampelinus]MCS4510556.1 helix-hairpin-helix domain-containing protein [Xylophilus ampelinus]PYE77817.1 competence protein ComEA [Xylophilus ampelinus]
MLKKMLAIAAMLCTTASFGAVDVNQASAADLDGIKGIGPAKSTRILDERKKSPYKDWPDFIARVRGVGTTTASKYSAEGLTVNGVAYPVAKPVAAAPLPEKPAKPVRPQKSEAKTAAGNTTMPAKP